MHRGDTGEKGIILLVTGLSLLLTCLCFLSGVWEKRYVVLGHFLDDPCSGLAGSQHPDLLHGPLQDR